MLSPAEKWKPKFIEFNLHNIGCDFQDICMDRRGGVYQGCYRRKWLFIHAKLNKGTDRLWGNLNLSENLNAIIYQDVYNHEDVVCVPSSELLYFNNCLILLKIWLIKPRILCEKPHHLNDNHNNINISWVLMSLQCNYCM